MKTRIFFIFFILIFVFQGSANAQTCEGKTTVISPATKVKERLEERLQMLIHFQSSGKYEELFSLIVKGEGVTKDSYALLERRLDESGRARLTKFTVKKITLPEPDYAFSFVEGCGEYLEAGKKTFLESQVIAWYGYDDDWCFLDRIMPDISRPKKCVVPE